MLVKTGRSLDHVPRVSDLADLGYGPILCLSDKFPGDIDAAGLRTSVWELVIKKTERVKQKASREVELVLEIPCINACMLYSQNCLFSPYSETHLSKRALIFRKLFSYLFS